MLFILCVSFFKMKIDKSIIHIYNEYFDGVSVIILCKGYIDVYITPDVPGVFVLLPNCHDIKHRSQVQNWVL